MTYRLRPPVRWLSAAASLALILPQLAAAQPQNAEPNNPSPDQPDRQSREISEAEEIISQAPPYFNDQPDQRSRQTILNPLGGNRVSEYNDDAADVLGRLPGVTVIGGQGQGRNISVRGTGLGSHAATLNGLPLPILQGDARSATLDMLSSKIIQSVTIKKTLVASDDADFSGAKIEINTRSAFDRADNHAAITLEGVYNSGAKQLTPKGAADFTVHITDRLGLAGAISYDHRKLGTDLIYAYDWRTSDENVNYARELVYRDYDIDRRRTGAALSLDYRLSDSTNLYARGHYSRVKDQEYIGDLTLVPHDPPSAGDSNSAQFSDEDGIIQVRRRMKDRLDRLITKSAIVGGQTVTDLWKFQYSASYAVATKKARPSFDPLRFRHLFDGEGLSITMDYSNPRLPSYEVTSNKQAFDNPATYGFNELERLTRAVSKDTEWAANFDAEREFELGQGTFTLHAGAKSLWRRKSNDMDWEFYDGINGSSTLADYAAGNDFAIRDIGVLPSQNAPADFFNENGDRLILNPYRTAFYKTASDYAIKEQIFGAYVMGEYERDAFQINAGLRMERTHMDINGFRVNDAVNAAKALDFERQYSNWLPSLSMRYDAKDNLTIRFAAYKSLSRPNLHYLAPRFHLDNKYAAEIGNPYLKAARAWNIDLGVQYNLSKNTALMANLYYKSIDDFFTQYRTPAGVRYDLNYVNGTGYQNGDDGEIKGIEFSIAHHFRHLPAPWDGLSINANYSYNDATGSILDGGELARRRTINLPSSSKHIANVELAFETGDFAVRAAGNYRSKYMTEVGYGADRDLIVDHNFRLDLSASYEINDMFEIFCDWSNVTNAKYFAYEKYAGAKRLRLYQDLGSTVRVGATMTL